jgi:hypothetical protein
MTDRTTEYFNKLLQITYGKHLSYKYFEIFLFKLLRLRLVQVDQGRVLMATAPKLVFIHIIIQVFHCRCLLSISFERIYGSNENWAQNFILKVPVKRLVKANGLSFKIVLIQKFIIFKWGSIRLVRFCIHP